MMTTPLVVAGIVWSVAVLWVLPSDSDRPPGGTMMSRETFPTLAACIPELPRYQRLAREQFVRPGPVVCVETKQ